MALQSSGQITLNDIHVEVGGTSGTQASLNDADIRGLINSSSSSEIQLTDFYGASNAAEFMFATSGTANSDHDDISYPIGFYGTGTLQNGDLIIAAVSSDNTLTGAPTGPSQMINIDAIAASGISYPGHYVEYGYYNTSMGNYLQFNGNPTGGAAISGCVAVFRNAGSLQNSNYKYRNPGLPDPDNLSSASPTKLIVLTAHLNRDAINMTAPTGYTLATAKYRQWGSYGSSTAIAYKITNTSQAEDAGAFGGNASDANWAYAFRFG